MHMKYLGNPKQEGSDWVQVVPENPNGMKLELYIFDAFKYCQRNKVALLEVHREEEFAPVKNAAGPGVPDTVNTARDLVLRLQRRLASSTVSEPQSSRFQLTRKIRLAYLGGCVEEDIL
jgi:UDP-N-acetylglucosamine/UDP-N-acetylgalactosamine diphosphorylase